jgi:monoamine oxidase
MGKNKVRSGNRRTFSVPHDEFDVVVVGAGAAGVAAADRLASTGLSFVVLEARDRPGGRAWTVTPAAGLSVDLGCGWLHSAENNPWAAIAVRQGRTLDKSPPPWARTGSQVGPNRKAMDGFNAAIGRFRERVAAFPADGPDAALDTLLEAGDPFNPLIDAVSTYYSGAELAKVSVRDLAAYEDSGVNWRVREGYGAVVAGLAATVPVRYQCPVRAIDHSGRWLALESELGVVRCRAVIVTLSTGLIARTPELFRPALFDKTEAAEHLPLGLADKVYFQLDDPEAFEPDTRAFGNIDVRATAAYHLRPRGRPIIECYFGGELAERLEPGGMEAASAFAADELVGLFGAGIRKTLRPMCYHGWRTDPWAAGAYSYARPGFAGCRTRLAEPVDERIFFAGEACSPASYSTAHGAYETGVAAVKRAVRALAAR